MSLNTKESPEMLPPTTEAIQLCTNDTLTMCMQELQAFPFDFDTLALDFEKTRIFKSRRYVGGNITGMMFELHVKRALREIVYTNPAIQNNKISHNTKTEHFEFKKKHRQLIAYTRGKKITETISEYDVLSVIQEDDGLPLPVLWEAKIANIKQRGTGKLSKGSFRNVMEIEIIQKSFEPLQEFFKTHRFGYVIVANSDAINPLSTSQQDFLDRGGHILPLPITERTFRKHVLKQALQRRW